MKNTEKRILRITMKKGNTVKENDFIVDYKNLENEIKYWKWNVEKLGNWKIIDYKIYKIKED